MASAREEGIIKIEVADASEANTILIGKYNTYTHFPDAAKTNLTLAPVLPFGVGRTLKEDDYVQVYCKGLAADTLDYDDMNDCVFIPITRKILPTGQIIEDVLEVNDMELSAAPSTVAAAWVKILEYQIPAQQEVKLGQRYPADAVNSHVLIIPMDDTA